jgi:ribosomal protein S18 acetylase RimI-like enzyme
MNLTIKIYNRQSLKDSELIEQIINLDLINMQEIMQRSEIEHPIEKRMKGFEYPGVIIAAFDHDKNLAGYLEYGLDWHSSDDIYIASVQIKQKYRNTKLFADLLLAAKEDLQKKNFNNIISHVQKTNINAIKLFRKLGFSIEEREDKPKSYRLIADKDKIFKQLTNFTN